MQVVVPMPCVVRCTGRYTERVIDEQRGLENLGMRVDGRVMHGQRYRDNRPALKYVSRAEIHFIACLDSESTLSRIPHV